VTVTPLQMLNAFNVVADGGNLVQPYLVKEVKYPNGVQEKFEPKIIRRVVKESTATTLKGMLTQVVETGHSRYAAVKGYYVAGKTGTAEVANPAGGYFHDRNIHTFIGFAPVDQPKFTILTKLDYPTSAPFAESTAAPLFSEIAKFLLEYYQIAPTR
jgi:cell division protein FtsI/penicillin-binding protein 2